MTAEEINRIKYMVCCPLCDNEKCVRNTDKCEAEIWAKKKSQESEDVISRQEVLDIIRFEDKWLLDAKGHTADTEIAFNTMKSKVSALLPVNPQEPILDKIRAEIEQSYCEVNNDYDHGRNYGLYMATQIIDKYKGGAKM